MKPPPHPPPNGGGEATTGRRTVGGQSAENARHAEAAGGIVRGQKASQKGENNSTKTIAPRVAEKEEPQDLGSQDSIVEETPQSPDWDTNDGVNEVDDEWTKPAGRTAQEDEPMESPQAQEPSQVMPQSPAGNSSASGNLPSQEVEATVPAEKEQEIQPMDMYEAVVAEITRSPTEPPREAWLATIAELFRIAHAKVKINAELVPNNKKRYPKLKGDEKAWLFKVFKAICMAPGTSFDKWERYAQAATRDLYNTSWTFKTIMQSMTGKAEWATTPPLNQWASKVKAGTGSSDEANRTNSGQQQYEDFMFNPQFYTEKIIADMRKMCAQPQGSSSRTSLRQATATEWEIIDGISEGKIVCRKMPAFVRSVLGSKEQMRFSSTIQSQVEGELIMQLRSRGHVKTARQLTQTLKDDIMLAAQKLQANTPELRRMLSQAKTISYNHIRRSIHMFFFDRQTATKYEDVRVPFDGVIYGVANAHQPDRGSVWARQTTQDGRRFEPRREYGLEIHNVTRFTDVGRLAAYLQQHIDVDVDMEDMDTFTPESRTSTVWKLTARSTECPAYLRGIVRLVWFGRTLVIKHPHMGQRLQCLRCGNLGHTMALCRYTDKLLLGAGSRVAEEQEVAKLADLAKPFASLAEMKSAAAKRLVLQAAADRKATAAVEPTSTSAEVNPTAGGEPATPVTPHTAPRKNQPRADMPVQPEPKKKFVTVPLNNGRTLFAHPAALRQRQNSRGSRFSELVDEDEEDAREEKTEDNPPTQEVIDVSSGEETAGNDKAVRSTVDKSTLHLVTAKPHKLHKPPQLTALKQRERVAVRAVVEKDQRPRGPLQLMQANRDRFAEDFPGIESSLAMNEVNTPPSGNCMAMAIAQALADTDLAAETGKLEELTRCVKRGIRWTAQLHLADQFSHYVRTTTLVNLGRGWDEMEPHESMKQFKWYLDDYATSPSGREDYVPRYNWGCSDLMATAANFLQRKIHVLAYDTDHQKKWHCSMYRPNTASKARQTYDIGQHVPMMLHRIQAAIRQDKIKEVEPPLVLRYHGEHYSALVHKRERWIAPTTGPHAPEDEKGTPPSTCEETPASQEASSDQEVDASTEMWKAEAWNGDVEDLRGRLTGMTIPHDLQCEIYQILETAEPDRYAELLAFLINTASLLTTVERQTLLHADLKAEHSDAVTKLMQKYQLSGEALKQWQLEVARQAAEEAEMSSSQLTVLSGSQDSDWQPSSTLSSQSSVSSSAITTRTQASMVQTPKRPHSVTPSEAERIREYMQSKIRRQSDGTDPAAQQDDPMHDISEDPVSSRDAWPEMWRQFGSLWPSRAAAHYPLASSTTAVWKQAAWKEPAKLLQLLQRFPYPEEVLEALSEEVLEAWTRVWRKECLQERLGDFSKRTDNIPTKTWIDSWQAKLSTGSAQQTLQQADSSDDWAQLRSRGYGKDEILRWCDVSNRERMAQYLICALLYEKEIRVLTGMEETHPTGPLPCLARHLHALKTVATYSAVYPDARQSTDWHAVARYFAHALECGVEQRDQQY